MLPADIDIDIFRAPAGGSSPGMPPVPRTPPRHRRGEPFLKGPIPWRWLETAMTLSGKALHIALILWREAGCTGTRTVRFKLSGAKMNVSAARRGLQALDKAGLVTIRRPPGRALEVTLQDVPRVKDC